MTKPEEREAFRIIDMVALIAATALGLAAIRAYATAPTWLGASAGTIYGYNPSSRASFLKDGYFLSGSASALLLAWSFALLWCGWRQGQRRVGKIVERPGLLACSVAILIVPFYFFFPITFEIAAPRGADVLFPEMTVGFAIGLFLGFLRHKVGACVLLAWVALVACQNWRKPHGWVEWAGLAVGIGWISIWLTHLVLR
jgi:hypothetical protein